MPSLKVKPRVGCEASDVTAASSSLPAPDREL